ncbi:MAG: pyridoxine 5'-phosphate synthase [Pseudomonadota bacterium]|nr:pyridoxine 5'-phosphate synthase [Pseudomonadota bacterium]
MTFFNGVTSRYCLPDPVLLARAAEQAGVGQITLAFGAAPTADEQARFASVRAAVGIDVQLAMPFSDDVLALVRVLMPQRVRLLGIDLKTLRGLGNGGELSIVDARLAQTIDALRAGGVGVVLPIGLDVAQVATAAALGAERVEVDMGSDPVESESDSTNALTRETALRAVLEIAADLGISVVLSGDIALAALAGLADLSGVRQIELGGQLVERAILTGWTSAITDCLAQLAGRARQPLAQGDYSDVSTVAPSAGRSP